MNTAISLHTRSEPLLVSAGVIDGLAHLEIIGRNFSLTVFADRPEELTAFANTLSAAVADLQPSQPPAFQSLTPAEREEAIDRSR